MKAAGERGGPPHPVDIRVGARLRQRRLFLGMNQAALGTLLGLTFQQVQKYESAANRISAGRLHYVARLLDVPVEWFFQPVVEGEPVDREELDLLSLYHQLPGPTAAAFLELMQCVAVGAGP